MPDPSGFAGRLAQWHHVQEVARQGLRLTGAEVCQRRDVSEADLAIGAAGADGFAWRTFRSCPWPT